MAGQMRKYDPAFKQEASGLLAVSGKSVPLIISFSRVVSSKGLERSLWLWRRVA